MRSPTKTRTHRRLAPVVAATLSLAWPAAEATAAPAAESSKQTRSGALKWLTAVTPRRHMFETGFFGGAWLPSRALELHDRNLPFVQYREVGSELGLRLAYFPLRHFGFEGELAMMPGRTTTDQRTFVSTARAHAILQLGLSRLVPFALIGGGVLSVRSEDLAAGDDADQALVVGGGAKLMLTPNIVLRLDVRDVMSPKRGIRVNDPADSIEVLLGFSLALGPRVKKKKPEGPPDLDGDKVPDAEDACPNVAARTEDGCPFIDSDDDGFEDRTDECPQEPGAAPAGCPIPDSDDDGFLDPDDACPDEAGVPPDGCPIRDEDGDGLLAPADACPTEPETVNGWEDEDGCPDDLPEEVKAFTGVLEGIEFASNRATIRPTSTPKLEETVKILQQFPALRVRITGHTDDRGDREKNVTLSQARADAVKQYLVDAGIDASRIQTEGLGPDRPREDNATSKGRQKNRRIEIEVIIPEAAPADAAPTEAAPTDAAPTDAAPAEAAPAEAAPAPGGPPHDAAPSETSAPN